MDPERQIQFIAKWICIFCFKMKGAAVFDWTVLRCDHLVSMDCFKKNKDFLKNHEKVSLRTTFSRKCIRLRCNAYSHQ